MHIGFDDISFGDLSLISYLLLFVGGSAVGLSAGDLRSCLMLH